MPILERSVLLVSGAPASGKSTVATALAERLGFPLIAKDPLKESLYDSLGPVLAAEARTPEALSRALSRAAADLLWSVAPGCPQVILEANFRTLDPQERARFAALPGRKLEVWCHCSPAEAARRFARRAETARCHPAHSLKQLTAEILRDYDQPFGLSPVIDVDTEQPLDVASIVQRIRDEWKD